MELAHVALWVSDMDASLDFYLDGLGFERNWSFELDGVENVYVGPDGGELQLRHDPDRTTPVAPSRADVDHVAFELDDAEAVEEAFERLEGREDCSVVVEPQRIDAADAYVTFVADPDDYTIELFASV